MMRNYLRFVQDYLRFRRLHRDKSQRHPLRWRERHPCLHDNTATTSFDAHYVYHPAWAARIVERIRPQAHVDISSTLQFCAIVSAFVPVRFFDYRPVDLHLPGLTAQSADLLALPFPDASIPSLSCMHVVEHVGLGRYGDQLDPEGDMKAFAELRRVTEPGGSLLLVLPIGRAVIAFNAHRIYSYHQIREMFKDFDLVEFSLVPDDSAAGGLICNATEEQADAQRYAAVVSGSKRVRHVVQEQDNLRQLHHGSPQGHAVVFR